MSWRIISIQNDAKLNIKNKQLLISQKDKEAVSIPLADICAIVFDSPQIKLTSYFLSIIQNHNIVLITCDNKHIPNGTLIPFHQHSRLSEIAHLQHQWSLSYQKKCWKIIIQQKIINQAKCLDIIGKHNNKIKALVKKVDSGDSKNIEALASQYYWINLFSSDFRRKEKTSITSSLNYGYSIVRSMICRALVAYGLLPCFGVHHKNSLNAFNLADDILEPFRPIVDLYVKEMIVTNYNEKNLTKEIRANLLKVTILPCLINNQIQDLHNAADLCISSLVSSIRQNDVNILKLPSLYHG